MTDESGAKKMTHLDESGQARMVDVGEKAVSAREARAEALVMMSSGSLDLVLGGELPKGEALPAARIAGISAAKKTSELIPLCHPLRIDAVAIDFDADPERSCLRVTASVRATDRTGVEMEALVAAAVASLTIYDMVKAVERGATITGIRLLRKSGGKSGTWEVGDEG